MLDELILTELLVQSTRFEIDMNGLTIMKAYDLSSIDVLLVDDHKFTLSYMREILRILGVREIRVAEDVDSAIKMSGNFKPDIIFCDIEMPGKNGIELIKQIRDGGSEWDPRIPIITFTSFTEQNRVHALRDAGSSHYLAKPISPASVYSRMVRIIDEKRPFIKTDDYKGPDRRRKNNNVPYDGKERRKMSDDVEGNSDMSLSQEELDVLFEKNT